ncbi:predicted protein [Sclerotinia sclerotiorum 1980 UF-70]|uniref:Uncharacterized protein n=1 Tax=Sclerotinia sclerotiorum (strain ATCC 18683 / 1980 / Ss-1) TaxID=665079 RepID=A7ELU2_SCLS1|nr:predicted protein [Sclerotinia sclerotiorum 1980 UF-70]EDO03808.1 predicted protein [Sclerotinia sclerotiorum 1980 UF-70]
MASWKMPYKTIVGFQPIGSSNPQFLFVPKDRNKSHERSGKEFSCTCTECKKAPIHLVVSGLNVLVEQIFEKDFKLPILTSSGDILV